MYQILSFRPIFLFFLFNRIAAEPKQTIFCLIHTAKPSHGTRAETIAQTWAKRCDDYMFFTNSPMRKGIPHIYWPELGSRDHSWEKIRRVFGHMAKSTKKFDWYIRADDDAYVIVDNLRAFLSKYSSRKPHYFGYKWNFFVTHGYADGGAYVLSRPAVLAFARVMKDKLRCPDHHRAEEDQEMAKCLETVGIYPEDTRDHNGSDRFHHFHPSEQLEMFKDPFARKFSYYQPLKGIDNFSPQMISFHHISPYEMRVLDYIFYRLERRVMQPLPELLH